MNLLFKFIVVLALFCLGVAVNIYAAIWASNSLLSEAKTAFETSFEAANLVGYIQSALIDQDTSIAAAGFAPTPPSDMPLFIERNAAIVSADLERLQACRESGDDQPLADLRVSIQRHQDAALDLVTGVGLGAENIEELTHLYREQHLRVTGALKLLAIQFEDARQAAAGQTLSATEKVIGILVGMGAIELLLLIVILSLFRDWIIQPILKIREATREIASGNLAYRLDGSRRDELGALADQVNRMAESLVKAQSDLKQSERLAAVGEMVNVVAHNIRNPLAGIRATAQAAMHMTDDDAQHPLQRQIIDSVDSLEQWLKELLHLNRPLELSSEPVAVAELVGDLQHIFQPSLERKALDLRFAPRAAGEVIRVDRQYFTQAVASILDNAIAAAPHGSAVAVSTHVINGAFRLEIADSGPGISDGLYKQVFQSYFSTKPGGTGIGLSMAKKIIEAHNGRLEVVSPQDRETTGGATLRIELDIARLVVKGNGHG